MDIDMTVLRSLVSEKEISLDVLVDDLDSGHRRRGSATTTASASAASSSPFAKDRRVRR